MALANPAGSLLLNWFNSIYGPSTYHDFKEYGAGGGGLELGGFYLHQLGLETATLPANSPLVEQTGGGADWWWMRLVEQTEVEKTGGKDWWSRLVVDETGGAD
ncbi:unnamed protein product [Boreogadus saida]